MTKMNQEREGEKRRIFIGQKKEKTPSKPNYRRGRGVSLRVCCVCVCVCVLLLCVCMYVCVCMCV